MNSAVFSAAREAFQVSHISYAGPVHEIPEQSRKSECTHSFKMITSMGVAYCYYRSQETAKKARGVLSSMFEAVKPQMFHYIGEAIDPLSVVSFSAVYELKEPKESFTHAFTLTLKACEEKNPRLCLRFKSADAAQNSRKALWAAINAANGVLPSDRQPKKVAAEPVAVVPSGEPADLPF